MTNKNRQSKPEDKHELAELLKNVMKDQFKAICEQATKNARLGDWLKTMEVYLKMTPDETAQKKVWKDLEKVRHKVLARKKNNKAENDAATRRTQRKK